MRRNEKGVALLELLIGITVSAMVFVFASSIVVSLFSSDTNSRKVELIEQSKSDMRTNITNGVKWADSIQFIEGDLIIDGITYNVVNGRFFKDGSPITNEGVIVEGFNIKKNSTETESRDPGSGKGLQGEYFNGVNFDESVVAKIDRNVDFDWGVDPVFDGLSGDNFSVRWSGQVEARETGSHRFYVSHNDGVRLSVGDREIIDNWVNGSSTDSGSINLDANKKYNILLEYFESSGDAGVTLEWSGGFPREVIPQAQLYPNANQASLEVTATMTSVSDPDITDTLTIILSPRIPGSIGTIQSNP